jgi:hypothetical protein
MNKKTKFVITTDKETANKLIAEGFRLITEISGTYTFENKPGNLVFDKVDSKKVAYTNMLSL